MTTLKVVLVFATVICCCCWFVSVQAGCGCGNKESSPKLCKNPPFDVIKKCPPNEVFSCCGACEQLSCNKPYSTVRCIRCPSGCYCQDGYLRENLPNGELGGCIPIEYCPVPLIVS